jgi:hypothetical protein
MGGGKEEVEHPWCFCFVLDPDERTEEEEGVAWTWAREKNMGLSGFGLFFNKTQKRKRMKQINLKYYIGI